MTVLVQTRGPCLTAVRSKFYQKQNCSAFYRLNISCFFSLQKTPSAVVTMYRGTALWTTVNLESSICYWQKTLRCSRCRLLLVLLLSFRYDPAMVPLAVTSRAWNVANITLNLVLISQMLIILSSSFAPYLNTMDLIFELLLWRYSVRILPGLSNGKLSSQDRDLSDGKKIYTPKQTWSWVLQYCSEISNMSRGKKSWEKHL